MRPIDAPKNNRRVRRRGPLTAAPARRRRRSQVKYVSRVRQRVSSFWSMTFVIGGEVHFQCLVEIWHLRRGSIVHQAEGPRPRTIPTAMAWYFLEQWCEREGLDLTSWDCYS